MNIRQIYQTLTKKDSFAYQVPKAYHGSSNISYQKAKTKFDKPRGSFRESYLDPMLACKKKQPGPGKYNIQTQVKRFSKSKSDFSKSKRSQFSYLYAGGNIGVPGVGKYNAAMTLEGELAKGKQMRKKGKHIKHPDRYLFSCNDQFLGSTIPGVGQYSYSPRKRSSKSQGDPAYWRNKNKEREKRNRERSQSTQKLDLNPYPLDCFLFQTMKQPKTKQFTMHFGSQKRFRTEKKPTRSGPGSYVTTWNWLGKPPGPRNEPVKKPWIEKVHRGRVLFSQSVYNPLL